MSKKYMHPTRRKLVDLVFNGKYDKTPIITVPDGDKSKTTERKVGEIWTDHNGVKWEQKEGYKVKHGSLSNTMEELRKYLDELDTCKSKDCKKAGRYARYSNNDKKLIQKTGYCADCLARLEHPIRVDGLYVAYENYKIFTNMLNEGNAVLERLQEAYDTAKQEYEYVTADGKVEKWKMDKPVDELKAEIKEDIEKIKAEVELVKEKRKEVYDMLKDKNYEILKNDRID